MFKKIFKRLNFSESFIVFGIAVISSFFNIFHVITNFLKTPPGYFYTGTGHYFLDYFSYLQLIGEGIRGKWLPINYVAPTDNFVYLLYLPYTILGHIAKFFNLSPVFIYWFSIFILTIIVILSIYWVINNVLKNYSFYLKISALLISIFTGPFYYFKNLQQGQKLLGYDFWWGPQTFLGRFGLIPHQLLVAFLTLLIYIITSSLIEKINSDKLKVIIKKVIFISILLVIILVILPISTVIPLITITSILLIKTVYQSLKERQLKFLVPFLSFVFSISISFLPTALLLKKYYELSTIMTQLRAQDIGWNTTLPLSFLLLNIGPVLFVLPFGLKKFLKIKSPFIFLLLLSTFQTYLLYYTSVASFFGTHNLRLFSLTNYITFGILTALGIKTISEFFHFIKNYVYSFLILILLSTFSIYNYKIVEQRVLNKDMRTPNVAISYLPISFKESFSVLNKEKDRGCILTGPYSSIGMVLPVYIERKSCLGKPIYTPDFEKKQLETGLFLRGELGGEEVKEFLNKNDVKYIFLTSIDDYSETELNKYKFLIKIFSNSNSVIYKYDEML